MSTHQMMNNWRELVDDVCWAISHGYTADTDDETRDMCMELHRLERTMLERGILTHADTRREREEATRKWARFAA